MSEYTVLAILSWRACHSALAPTPDRASRAFTIALLLCVLYAASDEFHQSFVPSRGASVIDVAIDTMGVTVGLGIVGLYGRWRKFG